MQEKMIPHNMDATDNNSINCYLRAEDFIIDQPEAQ
jgi:hypothetical protein